MRDGFAVTEFADSGQQYSGYAYRDAVATARTDRIPIVYPRAGTVWRTDDGVTLTFIGPSLPFIESSNTINDNSRSSCNTSTSVCCSPATRALRRSSGS